MLKYRFVVAALLLPLSLLWLSEARTVGSESPVQSRDEVVGTEPSIRVYFSPRGGCTEAIIDAIAAARSSIDVQAYSFTSTPIAKALSEAHARGVSVRIILDKSQRSAKYTSATFLFNQKVPVFIDGRHAIAHDKVMLIDGRMVITGSFNFTKAAEESNSENLLVITDMPQLYRTYAESFEKHLSHAKRYEGLGK